MSDGNDSEEEFIPKRKSLKNTIASDDEEDDINSAPIHTEDITLCLSDDGDNEENPLESNPSEIQAIDEENQQISELSVQNDVSKTCSVSESPSPEPEPKKSSRAHLQSLFDSDSEPDESTKQSAECSYSEDNIQKEDSNDEDSPKKIKQNKNKHVQQKHCSVWDSDSDNEKPGNTKKPPPKLSSLFDSDSDPDQPAEIYPHEDNTKKSNTKSKKSAAGKQKKEKKNSKDAMLTIRSESQRMTRESSVSLPYHKPKQHSLSDFLNRRRLAPSSIKAPVEELVKFQKESEKEIKEFYQSESEHSDDDKEDDPDWNEEQEKKEDEDKTGEKENVEMDTAKENTNENDVEMETVKKNTSEETEMKTNEEVELKEDQETELKKDEESGLKKDEDEVVEMKNDEIDLTESKGEMETGGVFSEENKLVKENVLTEENVEEIQDCVVDLENRAETSETGKDKDTENDCQIIDVELQKSNTCPTDSQDLKLKYSEDLSEAIESRAINFDAMTDSEDEDVQLVEEAPKLAEPAKPKEEEKIILRGNPDDVIDFGDDFAFNKSRKEDLEGLKTRFMRHSIGSKPKGSPTVVSVKVVDLTADGNVNGINDETLTWTKEEAPVDQVPPGLKMKMLKMELERKIIEQREKEFEEKEASGEQAEKEGFEDGDDNEDILDDKDEDPLSDDDRTDDEVDADDEGDVDGEDEDDDEDIQDEIDYEEGLESPRKKKKNAFVDEEASVDDDLDERDSDSEDNEDDSTSVQKAKFSRTDTTADIFASQVSDEEDEIPGYQPCGGRRNASPLSRPKSTDPGSLESQRLSEMQGTPSLTFQRILQLDNDFNTQSTDIDTSQILGLGLENYTEERKKDTIMELAESPEVPETEADLMALCSGQFTTQPFPAETGNMTQRKSPLADSQESQDLQLKWAEDSPVEEPKSFKNTEGKVRLVIESSDEEGDKEQETTVKRKTKRLSFSDDDESNSVGGDEDDEVDDFINDDEEEEEDLPDPAEVMYDSDENEIPKNAAAFLENEAELSEDDYVGSGDEDEAGDNDQMEEELGDMDEFDQDKVREELGRIHMRNMLDDDRRDVRLMQEMLLEDGEFHEDGKGRQRQFRWKNADSATLVISQGVGSDEEGNPEDEDDDGGWRRIRHEREMFLAGCLKDKDGKTIQVQVTEQEEDSEIMILGKSILKRQSSIRMDGKEPAQVPQQQVAIPDSPMKSLFSQPPGRGSFLGRTSDVLTRLAENASNKNGIVETKMKTSRNFVFAAISPPKTKEIDEDIENEVRPNTKRKAKRSLIAQPEKKTCTSQPAEYSGLFNYL